MKILKVGKRDIKVLIEKDEDIDKAYAYAEKKLKHFTMLWDYKTTKRVLILRKVKLKKCPICNKKDVLDFEYEDGEKVYKICAVCWLKLNS